MRIQKDHIVIAEDDKFLADMIGKVFRARGARVTVAYNGQEVLEVMEKDPADVLLLDILMPILDGYAVMEAMKQKRLAAPVIIMSNLSDKAVQEKCRKMNVKKYFMKNDMDEESLWPVVAKYLS